LAHAIDIYKIQNMIYQNDIKEQGPQRVECARTLFSYRPVFCSDHTNPNASS